MTNEPGGRLYKALVETNKASSQWGFAPGLREGGFIYFNADVRKENDIEEAKTTMLATLDELTTNPPSEEERRRAEEEQRKKEEEEKRAKEESERQQMRRSSRWRRSR